MLAAAAIDVMTLAVHFIAWNRWSYHIHPLPYIISQSVANALMA